MADRLTAEQEAAIRERAKMQPNQRLPYAVDGNDVLAWHDREALLAELTAVRAEKAAAVGWAEKLEASLRGICSESGQPIGEIVLGRLREKPDAGSPQCAAKVEGGAGG